MSQSESLGQQLATVRAQVTAESEKMLKAREEELERRAKQTFESITGGLDKNIKGWSFAGMNFIIPMLLLLTLCLL